MPISVHAKYRILDKTGSSKSAAINLVSRSIGRRRGWHGTRSGAALGYNEVTLAGRGDLRLHLIHPAYLQLNHDLINRGRTQHCRASPVVNLRHNESQGVGADPLFVHTDRGKWMTLRPMGPFDGRSGRDHGSQPGPRSRPQSVLGERLNGDAARRATTSKKLFHVMKRITLINNGSRKRVLLVSFAPLFAGGETHYIKLAKLLSPRYDLAALIAHPILQDRLRAIGVPVYRLDKALGRGRLFRYCICAYNLWQAIRDFRPDMVHLNGPLEGHCSFVPQYLGVPFVITRHNALSEQLSTCNTLLTRRSMRTAASVVCVSSVLERQVKKWGVDRTVVIPNWIDDPPSVTEYCPPSPSAAFRLLFVGRVLRDKGIHDLIHAMRKVPGATLAVVGDGPDTPVVRELATGLPVVFYGFRKDCSPFYQNADLLVFPSYPAFEGHPQVPIEGMAHGIPCLISDIEVALEAAANGEAAEVFRCGSVDDLAEKINYLHASPKRLKELSVRGLHRVNTAYTITQVQPLYFRVVDEAICSRGLSRG